MPFSPDTCSPELLAGTVRVASELGTWMTVHHYGGYTEPLQRIGALGPNVLLSHAPGISSDEVEMIGRAGATVVMCPSTTMKEASRIGSRMLPELLAAGVAVGLGCDSANSSNYLDGVRMMNLAALGFKDGRGEVSVVPAEQALEMATLTGARSVGLDADIGSIEVGKKADLVVFDARRAEWRSLLDPVNNLVYAADSRSIAYVVADGRVVVAKGQVTFADEARVAEKVQELGEALLARTGTRINRGRWPLV
jgi:cytosine/adenosine deaminase-related metal-dependent hydrolase